MAGLACLLVLALVASACAKPTPDGAATIEADHVHDDSHLHDDDEEAAGDDHSHDDEAVGIDHHGNPIFDENERVYEQVLAEGLSIEFTVENFLGVGGRGGEVAPRLVEGGHAVLHFNITDAAAGTPVTGLTPAVWLDTADAAERSCQERIGGYLQGTLDTRPLIDLNSYFVLGMNQDTTVSVIDPLVDVGGMTNLFALILLQGSGEDWAMGGDPVQLFITMPDLGKVAVVNLDGFVVEENVDLGGRSGQIATRPGGNQVWVGVEPTRGDDGGVAIIDAASRAIVGEIATGAGPHAIAFSPDGSLGYVADSESGTVTVVDAGSLEVLRRVEVGSEPIDLATSPQTGILYVADGRSGRISVLDGSTYAETARLAADRGLTALEISPDGRWGVAINAELQKAYMIETSTERITHAVPLKGTPDQITFTGDAAFIHSNDTPAVFAIPFAEVDPLGNISVLTVPVGSRPPGNDARADAIVPTPDGNALLIASPADDTIYFYPQGSQASAGGFQGHTLAPRAVTIVDRSLKERSPGIYNGSIRIPDDGEFVVAFLLGDPGIEHCFSFVALADEEAERGAIAPQLEVLTDLGELTVDVEAELRVSLSDADGNPVVDVEDLLLLVSQADGNWSDGFIATASGDGNYQWSFSIPRAGLFQMYFAAGSLGATYADFPIPAVRVVDPS